MTREPVDITGRIGRHARRGGPHIRAKGAAMISRIVYDAACLTALALFLATVAVWSAIIIG